MSNVSMNSNIGNYPVSSVPMTGGENFTALDKEKLKQDSIELSNKAVDNAKDNWLIKNLKGLGIEDPKKTMISIAGTVLSVVGIAVLGNKLAPKTVSAGLKIDDFLLNGNNFLSKGYRTMADGFSKIVSGFKSLGKNSATIQDFKETFTTRKAVQKNTACRGYEKGASGIFRVTPVEVLKNALHKTQDEPSEVLKKIMSDDKANKLASMINEDKVDPGDICKLMLDGIGEKFNCADDPKKLNEVLMQLKNGDMGDNFIDLVMMDRQSKGFRSLLGRLPSDWWPVRIIDKIGEKVAPNSWKGFGRGNLGDALQKYNIMSGKSAKTLPAKMISYFPTLITESYSNFVNDKSGLGVFLGLSTLVPFFNDLQDAPKEKKASNVLNTVLGSAFHWALAMPVSFGVTYSLASLKNLEGKTLLTKFLRFPGKFFGMGLDSLAKDGTVLQNTSKLPKVKGFVGGFIRFALIMFVLSPKVGNILEKVSHKIFGKPYSKAEEDAAKQAEEQSKQVIPELGITQEELAEKMKKNPDAAEKIQSDPRLVEAIQKNPKLLVDYLDGKDILATQPQTTQPQTKPTPMSNVNQNVINRRTQTANNQTAPAQNNTNNQNPFAPNNNTTANTNYDTATYIPSSAPIQASASYSDEKMNEYNLQMEKADKVLANAEKYI